ncbi:hypothetical protein [Bdellovibrio sp. HCB209]|uniref:hypothetical protein n=1 Tax=Bdellovibrio sp. HCB209 TaxID=3394354 RepID=UPI0039B64149
MKIRWNATLNFLIFLALLLLIAGIQTTLWFQFFGNTAAPLLWLNLIVYMTLYRKPFPAIFTIYAMGAILLIFTAMPLKMMLFSLLILFSLVYGIKSRVFWTGGGYFTIMCGFSAVAYHLIYFLLSMVLEKNPASFELFDRFLQIIMTPACALPMYWLLSKIDKVTQDELVHEPGGFDL